MIAHFDLAALETMIREAPPGSWLAVAPDVFDAHKADLAVAAACVVGHSIHIERSPRVPPGTFAVMDPPKFPGAASSGFLTKFGPKKPAGVPPPGPARSVAARPTPPPPPRPEGPPPQPRSRVRIIDT
jgi:hypothetical protein